MMLSGGLFLGSAAVSALLLKVADPILRSPLLARENYAGKKIPTAVGILFVPAFLITYVASRLTRSGVPTADDITRSPSDWGGSMALLVTGMGFLGLMDDLFGEKDVSGFRGHFKSALKGRLTTGLAKAIGGFLLALAASSQFSKRRRDHALNAGIIALSANLFNLLDMRPGRALKVFFPSMAVTVILNRSKDGYPPYALSVGGTAAALMPGDLSEEYMLGDAGSNILGATVGLGLATGLMVRWKTGLICSLALLNLLSEKYSFSSIIDANNALRWLDGLGRKGESEPGAN